MRIIKVSPRSSSQPLTHSYCDVAASIQDALNHVMLELVNSSLQLVNTNNVCMAGGVALNCVTNGLINRNNNVNFWVQPASGDAGGALGSAAYMSFIHDKGFQDIPPHGQFDYMQNALLGPHFSNLEIKEYLDSLGLQYEYMSDKVERGNSQTPQNGSIVALFEVEWNLVQEHC